MSVDKGKAVQSSVGSSSVGSSSVAATYSQNLVAAVEVNPYLGVNPAPAGVDVGVLSGDKGEAVQSSVGSSSVGSSSVVAAYSQNLLAQSFAELLRISSDPVHLVATVGVNPYHGVNPAAGAGVDAGALYGDKGKAVQSSVGSSSVGATYSQNLRDMYKAHQVLHRQDEALAQAHADLQLAHDNLQLAHANLQLAHAQQQLAQSLAEFLRNSSDPVHLVYAAEVNPYLGVNPAPAGVDAGGLSGDKGKAVQSSVGSSSVGSSSVGATYSQNVSGDKGKAVQSSVGSSSVGSSSVGATYSQNLLAQTLAELLRNSSDPVHLAGVIVQILNDISSRNAIHLHKKFCFYCGHNLGQFHRCSPP